MKREFCPLNSFDMNVLDIGIWVELKARNWEKNPAEIQGFKGALSTE